MIWNETYTLANGVRIPKLGLGTWTSSGLYMPGIMGKAQGSPCTAKSTRNA